VSTKDAAEHLESTTPLFLAKDEPDYLPMLQAKWAARQTGSIQPTSPLALGYVITYVYERIPVDKRPDVPYVPYTVKYKLKVKWAPHMKVLVKMLKPHQLWHRSRLVALAAGPLRIAEAYKRIKGVQDNITEYRKLALTDRESHEVFQIVLENTKRNMHLNFEYISTYINKHKDKSLGGSGYKWADAYTLTKSDWKIVFELVRANLDAMEDHPTWYVSNPPLDGLRSRANEFTEGDCNDLLSLKTEFSSDQMLIEFCRIILFGNHMSLYTAFIPQKVTWYTDTLLQTISALKASGTYHFPYIEGGMVYKRFADLHANMAEFHATDGKKWESGVGTILGPYFNCMMVPFGGITHVASGQSHTSMNDSLAMIAASRNLDCTKVILGDDLNIWGGPPLRSAVIEEQPYDTKFKYCLGLSYSDDPYVPRTTGIKISTDRSGKMIPIPLDEGQEYAIAAGGKHSKAERLTHAQMYLGRFGSGTLLERLTKIPASEFVAPSELLEQIALTEAEDVFDWARELGIDRVAVR